MPKRVRTRFAPSPTGMLHIGSARTALYSYIFAKKHGGDFLLRIEDTDQARSVPGAVENIITSLAALGIKNDEGVMIENGEVVSRGPLPTYFQSQRLEVYRKYVDQLLADGNAYYSFKTPEELEALRNDLNEKHKPLKKRYLNENFTAEEVNTKIAQGIPYTIRLAVPESGTVTHHDLVRGEVTFDYSLVDDQVILKSDGFPTYHLAAMVDDIEMEITHVIRGEEWLSSTPKHLFIYHCLKKTPPQFAHLALLLNPDRTKLSKRQGDVALMDYLEKGFLPETLVNFIALLGWNPGQGSTQEIFSMNELIHAFSFDHIHKAGAVFDQTKLHWMSEQYLRNIIPHDRVQELFTPLMKENLGDRFNEFYSDKDKFSYLVRLIKERISIISEVPTWFAENQWIFKLGKIDKATLVWKKSTPEQTQDILTNIIKVLEGIADWNIETLDKTIREYITTAGITVGDALWPMRYALTAQDKSPNPFEVAYVLGKEESIRRLNAVLSTKH